MGVAGNLKIRGVEVRSEPPHGRIKGPRSAPVFKAIPRPWSGHRPPPSRWPLLAFFPKGTLPVFPQ